MILDLGMERNPTERFSTRVENYVKYRPGYPSAIVPTLAAECGLVPAAIVADVGSGTGLLSVLFLQNGNEVYAVEPNREMREAGERWLGTRRAFHSVAGRAEATTLPAKSVAFVIAAQAFHWFDLERTRVEFERILQPSGWVVLIWNERKTRETAFLAAYERLLRRYATDYDQVNHQRINTETLAEFYGGPGFGSRTFENRQTFDFEGLRGRLLSSSYAPEAGHPHHAPMMEELERVFEAQSRGGRVAVEYVTRVFYGHLA